MRTKIGAKEPAIKSGFEGFIKDSWLGHYALCNTYSNDDACGLIIDITPYEITLANIELHFNHTKNVKTVDNRRLYFYNLPVTCEFADFLKKELPENAKKTIPLRSIDEFEILESETPKKLKFCKYWIRDGKIKLVHTYNEKGWAAYYTKDLCYL